MRRAAKTDVNQPAIVEALRSTGATVQILAAVGGGCPDLLVGFRGKNLLIEVKDGEKPPSKQRLTKDQEVWHADWAGHVAVANSVDRALEVLYESW